MPATRSNAYIAGIAFVVLFVGSISLVLIGVVHQIVSPILNSESKIFKFNELASCTSKDLRSKL